MESASEIEVLRNYGVDEIENLMTNIHERQKMDRRRDIIKEHTQALCKSLEQQIEKARDREMELQQKLDSLKTEEIILTEDVDHITHALESMRSNQKAISASEHIERLVDVHKQQGLSWIEKRKELEDKVAVCLQRNEEYIACQQEECREQLEKISTLQKELLELVAKSESNQDKEKNQLQGEIQTLEQEIEDARTQQKLAFTLSESTTEAYSNNPQGALLELQEPLTPRTEALTKRLENMHDLECDARNFLENEAAILKCSFKPLGNDRVVVTVVRVHRDASQAAVSLRVTENVSQMEQPSRGSQALKFYFTLSLQNGPGDRRGGAQPRLRLH
eukprot:g9220.t1